jgi:hypothetical protein
LVLGEAGDDSSPSRMAAVTLARQKELMVVFTTPEMLPPIALQRAWWPCRGARHKVNGQAIGLQPISYDQERRPIPGMAEAVCLYHLKLCTLERLRLGDVGLVQPRIELRDQT